MGCGQSKIGNFYSKNKKNKNGSKRNGFSTRNASIEQKNGNGNNKANKTNNNGAEVNRNEELNGSLDKSLANKKKPVVPCGGPLLQQTEISTSQLDFFRMLDEKIESGPDYDESSDASQRREHIASMLRRWELASASWSNVVDLNRNNNLRASSSAVAAAAAAAAAATATATATVASDRCHPNQVQTNRGSMNPHQLATRGHANYKSLPSSIGATSNKERERPERARFDGLQDVGNYHCPSPPTMPRHVLEPISQSPTQSLRPPPGAVATTNSLAAISSPTSVGRYSNGSNYSPYARHDSPGGLIRNSPGNPYVHQFQIQSRNRVT